MPPVSSPAGSRTTLVTWAVVFAILWVTASIFAIYFYATASKAEDRYTTEIKRYIPEVISDSDLNGDAVQRLRAARSAETAAAAGINPQMPLFQVALAQRDQMAQLVAGAEKETAAQRAADALKNAATAGKDVNLAIPSTTDNLAGAVTTL